MTVYEKWLQYPLEDSDLKEELESIRGQEAEISDRFYQDLEFGTGGLRGVIGAGTNRMNLYTVRRATQGIANMLLEKKASPSVAIGYDSRHKSNVFAREVACVFAANGIRAYLSPSLCPTPMLSFAVRFLGCDGGVMITASHNPAKYNGYKAYGPDGCQMNLTDSERAISFINSLDIFKDVKYLPYEEANAQNLIQPIPQEAREQYLTSLLAQRIHPEAPEKADLKVVYTPLNGAGNRYVREALKRSGVTSVSVVPEQENPDPDFTTCPYPNPEIREALSLAIQKAKQEDAELVLATDPDSDRVGIAVKDDGGEFRLFSGNEVGALLLSYIAQGRMQQGTMPHRPVAIKTIVTTRLADAIAQKYGIELLSVLTGFKFIGEQIARLEEQGEENRYLFGFEESYGYLAGTYVRDKDAVAASTLICEMAAFYKLQGKSLIQAIEGLYQEYGIYLNAQQSFQFEGEQGMEQMSAILDQLRRLRPDTLSGAKVIRFSDYQEQVCYDLLHHTQHPTGLPKSNVVSLLMDNGLEVVVRPSGTEPKIKFYYSATAPTMEQANALMARLMEDTRSLLHL